MNTHTTNDIGSEKISVRIREAINARTVDVFRREQGRVLCARIQKELPPACDGEGRGNAVSLDFENPSAQRASTAHAE